MIDVENGETPIFKQPALVRSVVFKNWCQLPPLLLCLKHQIPEEMNQAERMLTVIQEVRSPGIMDADAFENRQDPNRVQRVLSAALINASLICCSTGASSEAVRLISSPTVPSLIWTPNRSRRTSQVRSNGNNCWCVK